MVLNSRKIGLLLVAALALVGCVEDNKAPEGLAPATTSGGAQVVFNLDARPFPEIPFPSDLATRLDPDSPTGRRLNVSYLGGSDQEEKVRVYVNKMTGFGVFSPISVKFNAPLDLQNLVDLHQEKVPNFRNDAVFLINIDPDSKEFGQLELLDMGLGNYPILHEEPDRYYENDQRHQGTNLVFESMGEEDLNGNGSLDPMEDTDDDGIWDVPNLLDPSADPYIPGNTLEWYERETNTLIMRPVHVLEPNTTYAVVLSDRLLGVDGNTVDSPFDYINHARQTEDLRVLEDLLPRALPERFSGGFGEVRFAWSFTTQDPTDDLKAIRAGLYGHGSMKRLANEYPPEFELIHNGVGPDTPTPLILDIEPLLQFLLPVLPSFFGVASSSTDVLEKNLRNIDYLVSGSFESPYFLADKDGLADTEISDFRNPQDDDEVFDIDPYSGVAHYAPNEVTWMCTVPKAAENRKPPFPTVIYSHAINSTKLEILLFGGAFAKFGFAVCAIDAVGHGVVIPPEYTTLIDLATKGLDIPNFGAVIEHDRARDLNNDGVQQSGGMFFTADILHTRDNFRQTAVDQMQFIRILRTWDGARRWPASVDEDSKWVKARRAIVGGFDANGDGESEIAGDFNGDGFVDFGGEQAFVGMGTSLGGIQTSLIAGVEPTIRAAVSNAGGGGLTDISTRSTIRNARDGVTLRMLGPIFTGNLVDNELDDGEMKLSITMATADEHVVVSLGTIKGIANGDKIVLRNPIRELRPAVPLDKRQSVSHVRDGKFRIAIAADADEGTRRLAKLKFDTRISAQADLLGCKERSACGVADCGRDSTCNAAEDACVPIVDCIQKHNIEDIKFVAEEGDDPAEAENLAKELSIRTVMDAREYGDPLIIEIYSEDGELKQVIDTFLENIVFENILYPKGTPLAALSKGLGLGRQTPDFRRFVGIAQTLIEGADPAVWGARYLMDPLEFPYETEPFRVGTTNFIMAATVGDQTVPVSGGIAVARTAGIVDAITEDSRYGMTTNQYLIDNYVYEGIFWLDRFPDQPGTLFDADDLDNGLYRIPQDPDNADPNADASPPVRATIMTESGYSALRLVYIKHDGEHTFNAPLADAAFDTSTFVTNQVGWWLIHRGHKISDDPCFEDALLADCDFYDVDTFEPPDLFSCATGGCAVEFTP